MKGKRKTKYSAKLRPYCQFYNKANSYSSPSTSWCDCHNHSTTGYSRKHSLEYHDWSNMKYHQDIWKISILCAVLSIILYINTIYADFAYDDSRAIVKNQDLHPETPISNIWYDDFWGTPLRHSGSHKSYRPLVVLTFRLNYVLHQLQPGGYHLVNVLLNTVTTVLYTWFIALVSRRTFIALISGLLFTIHPIHTEAVAGTVGRADVMCGLFFICVLLCYKKYCDSRNEGKNIRFLWLLAAIFLTVCSTLSKEVGITVLALAIVYDIFCHSYMTLDDLRTWRKEKVLQVLEGLGFLAVSGGCLLFLRLYFMGYAPPSFSPADNPAADNDSFLTRTMTFLYLPVFNFMLLVFPAVLSFDWSMGAIPLVESPADYRNFLSAAFYLALGYLIRYSLSVFFTRESETMSPPASPKLTNGGIKENNGDLNGRVFHLPTENSVHHRKVRRDSDSSAGSAVSIDANHNHQHHQQPLCVESYRHYSVILFGVALSVLPFLPATNMFFYVGFVVAERVLYIPSMGFCLIVGELLYQVNKKIKAQQSLKVSMYSLIVFVAVLLSLRCYTRCLDWRSEETLYKSGIGVNPAKAWGNLANILNNQGNTVEAENAYRQALAYRGNMADVHYNLGVLLQDQKRYTESLHEYNMAIECRPRLTVAHLNKGIVLALLNKKQEAIKAYKECADIDISGLKDPRMHENAKISALYNLGRLHAETGEYKTAIDVYNLALARRPEYYAPQSIYNLLGEAHYQSGNFNEAESAYRKSLEAKPDHLPAHLTMARLMNRMKRLEEAETWYIKAIRISQGDPAPHQHYAMYLSENNRPKESLAQWLAAERMQPHDFDIIFNTASAFRQTGDNDSAEKYYAKAVTLSPNSATAHMNLGAMYHMNKRYKLAEQSYLKAIELNPSDNIAQNNLKKLRNIMSKRSGS